MSLTPKYLAVIVLLAAWPAAAREPSEQAARPSSAGPATPDSSGAGRIAATIEEPALRGLIADVLERNPGIAAAAARARAAAQRAPQVRALPEPMVGLTAFLETPETRTGPQRLAAVVSQGLPWFGKLALKERAALYEAAALDAEVEAKRLALVTEVRRLYYEVAFLDQYRAITEEIRLHFLQHEEIARARYSTGVGLGQAVVKLQAEITRIEKELLDVDARRVALQAQLDALRDEPSSASLPAARFPETVEIPLDVDVLAGTALSRRPELGAADARIRRAETLVRLAKKGYRPDFTVGLTYTIVDPRDDAPGRAQPPVGNGDDVFGVQGGVMLPVWRRKLAAGVAEAEELQTAAEAAKRDTVATIRATVADLTQRVPLSWRQLRLVEDLLVVQAEEALESAQAAYIAGTLNALDLLDAEHVLFEAHTAVARSKADYLVGLARLEGAVGEPLQANAITERSDP